MLCSAVYRQSYAGEFGGFDIDIGADEGILDNWDEEPGGNQEAAAPEQSVNESNGMEAGGENSESSAGATDNTTSESSVGEPNKENQGSGTGTAEKENQGSSSSTSNKGNDAGVSIKEPSKSSDSASNKKNQGNSAGESNKKNQGNSASELNKKNQENSAGVPKKESREATSAVNDNSSSKNKEDSVLANSSMPAVSENKNAGEAKSPESATLKVEPTVEKERAVSEIKNTEIPKEEKNDNQKKITSLGMVFTAVGMAKTSPELKFYNSNDLNEKIDTNTTKNNNKNVYFEHKSKIPINEYPSIQIIRTAEEQDITILSLRLNGEEVFWHQEGDTLILDQPAVEKKNIVELIVVVDGSQIVRMPVWEF